MELDYLLNFCSKHNKIICYGAANYGYTTKHFIEMYGFKIDAFLVSGKVLHTDVENIPVFSIEDAEFQGDNIGIILSLTERNHENVKRKIKENISDKIDIYPVTEVIWEKMYEKLVNIRRNNLLKENRLIFERNHEYDIRITKIKEKYSHIAVSNIAMGTMGELGEWILYLYLHRKNEDNIFHLYYPYTILEQAADLELSGVNSFLTNRFYGEGIELLSKDNLLFWQYFIYKEKNMFDFYDELKYASQFTEDMLLEISLKDDLPSYILFDSEEEIRGKAECLKMGCISNFVCLSARDSFYINKLRSSDCINFIDEYRNSNIETRHVAVKYLQQHYIQVVRMGAGAQKEFSGDNVIDYATKYHSEFMDVYLAANCKFFVSDLNGIQSLAELFSKPMVITNASMLTTRYDAVPIFKQKTDIAILKKLWKSKEDRYLTIREMIKYEVESDFQKNGTAVLYLYKKQGIVPIENTSEEIRDVIKEMNERLDETYSESEEDKVLQAKYRKIVDEYPKGENILSHWRLGADFLRNNQWLLE